MEASDVDVFEHVVDGGMTIIILCQYGDRRYPVNAYLMQWHLDDYCDVASVPCPAFVPGDIHMPREIRPLDYGIT